MNAPHNSAQAHAWRKRTAAVFAAVGALIFSSGIVMLSAPAANADAAEKIGVCHRKASDDYVFLRVSTNAAGEPNGHERHLEGATGEVVDFPDYVKSSPSVPDSVVTDADFQSWCQGLNTGGETTTVPLAALDITSITACGGTGSVEKPKSPAVAFSISGGLWSGLTGDVVVTATLHRAVAQFAAPLPGLWELDEVDGSTATWTIHFGSSDALCTKGVIGNLAITPVGDCGTYGSIAAPNDPVNVEYSIEGGSWTGLSGEYDVFATLTAGATSFSGLPAEWSLDAPTVAKRTVDVGTYTACVGPTEVTPLEPEWVEAKCNSDARVVYTQVEGVSYATAGTVAPGEIATVTARALDDNYVLKPGSVTSWDHTFKAKPVGAACGSGTGDPVIPDPVIPDPVTPDPELTSVSPLYPSATDADCSHRGRLVVPAQPEGVVTTRSGAVPGDVTFTFAPAAGYAFPAGTDTEVTVTVEGKLSGEDCILGGETTSPKPHTTKPHSKPRDRAPIVLGTQAAVPTAVDAGLAGLPSASVSPISSPRLAQALVAGGLLLLIAGGSMGLGRRTRGARES